MAQRGFTLVELLITVAIVSLLLTMAIPSFSGLLARRSLSAAMSDLAADFRFARVEALRRSATVSICRSANGTSCATSGSWGNGWIIFSDVSPVSVPPAIGTGDSIIRVHDSTSGVASILGASGADPLTGVTYQATGWARAVGQTFVFTPASSASSLGTRLMCLSNQGRPSVRAQGVTVCN
ncbi:MAG: GspH/FimT family pseudopilin [Ramlibacter sp.]|nr:GspH/FimT family pseudopilin [Ramlibacter sp.]